MALEQALSILSSALSIAASVKGLMTSRGVSAEEAVADLAEGADAREALADPAIRDTVLVLAKSVISKDLLEQLQKEALQCQSTYIGDRQKAKGITDKQRATNKASQCMCSVLRDVKFHNNDKLPTAQLKDFWKTYNCQN